MLDISARFLYLFFVLFLSILLLMFVMFAVMVRYDPDVAAKENAPGASGKARQAPEGRERVLQDMTPLYRANLFTINLCLIVLAETLLIVLFVKYTVPATLIATIAVVFMTISSSERLRSNVIPGFLSRLVTNRYATLSHTDLMLLMILSGLIMAFLVSVLLREAGADGGGEKLGERPTSPHSSSPPL
jgi:hypothetical protein